MLGDLVRQQTLAPDVHLFLNFRRRPDDALRTSPKDGGYDLRSSRVRVGMTMISYGRIGTSSPPVVVCGHGRSWQESACVGNCEATRGTRRENATEHTQAATIRGVSCAQCRCRGRRGLSPQI